MSLRKSIRLALLGATAVVGFGSALDATAASPATGTLSVTATVVNNCQFTTNAVAFGNYDPAVANAAAGANLLATGSLLVTCTTGDSITIDFDQGGNPTGGSTALVPARQMVSGGTNLLGYTLFWPNAADNGTTTATPWGTGAGSSFVFTATGTQETVNVFGSVAKGQNVPAGAYTDTVNVAVNY
ncbi:MAG TPA: spore coat U domain-containing protein [Steroidobacteraceae bacterium]|nr:spore coat U domain-containing protein [Steroidobacteraceae bacterium]